MPNPPNHSGRPLLRGPSSGQALIELLFSGGLLIVLVSGAGWILKGAWERGRCAYLVFETTRGALAAEPRRMLRIRAATPGSIRVEIDESSGAVVGESRCGGLGSTIERVGFRKLESLAEWK